MACSTPQINITTFRAADVMDFTPRWEGFVAPAEPMRRWQLACEYERGGPGFTMRAHGTVIACAGVVLGPQGVGTAWMLASEDAEWHRVALHRSVKRMLEQVIRCFRLHRVQTVVSDGFPRSARWVEKGLGFEFEATLQKAGPSGEDRHIYVRLL